MAQRRGRKKMKAFFLKLPPPKKEKSKKKTFREFQFSIRKTGFGHSWVTHPKMITKTPQMKHIYPYSHVTYIYVLKTKEYKGTAIY